MTSRVPMVRRDSELPDLREDLGEGEEQSSEGPGAMWRTSTLLDTAHMEPNSGGPIERRPEDVAIKLKPYCGLHDS